VAGARAAALPLPRSWLPARLTGRELRLAASALLLLAAVLIAAEVVVTLVWQEPFSALSAKRAQSALSQELAEQERAASSAQHLAVTRQAGAAEMAVSGRRLERRTPIGEPLGRISIPKIGSKFVFVSGTGEASLKKGPGHYRDTVLPGEHGSVAIAGHRTTYLAPFRDLDKLRRGDLLIVKMPYGAFSYRTEGSLVVSPSDARPLRRVGHDRLVLTTCTPPFSAAKRLVVTGKLVSATPVGTLRPAPGKRSSRAQEAFGNLHPKLIDADPTRLFVPGGFR
jgi:sortase A